MTTGKERRDYFRTVELIAKDVLEQEEDERNDYLWETVDGNEFIIYYHNNMVVLYCTDNEDALEDQGLELDTSKGWRHILTQIAYCAMEQDVQDKVAEFEEAREEEDNDND